MDEIWVIKKNVQGEETWRYSGSVLKCQENTILLEAYFNRPDMLFHGILFGLGDRFVELYFNDRWFNIFEIHERGTDKLKGWYGNVTFPADFRDGEIVYIDLALDLLVFPDGRQLVLDEDEFAALDIPIKVRRQAQQGLAKLIEYFKEPFLLK